MEYTLKVGDMIAKKYRSVADIYEVYRVTPTTAIAVINGNEVRFKNPTSPDFFQRIGADVWSRESFKLATEADISEFKIVKMRERLSETNWCLVAGEKLKQIIEILGNDQTGSNK